MNGCFEIIGKSESRDAFALPVALVSQVYGTVAISPVDVNMRFIRIEWLELFAQFWRERKNEI
jgi:hypothetical protein